MRFQKSTNHGSMLWKAHLAGTWEGQVLCSWPLTSHLGLFFPLFCPLGARSSGICHTSLLLWIFPKNYTLSFKRKAPSISKYLCEVHYKEAQETLAFALETEIHTSNNGTFLLKFFQAVYSDVSLSLISSHILSTSLPTQFLVPFLSYPDLKQKTSKTDRQRQANKQESWSLFCVS